MKRILLPFTIILLLFCTEGCVSYYATPLTAKSIKGTADSIGPVLTSPDKGIHPYVSGIYFDKQLLSDLFSSAETFRGGALSAGFTFHDAFGGKIQSVLT